MLTNYHVPGLFIIMGKGNSTFLALFTGSFATNTDVRRDEIKKLFQFILPLSTTKSLLCYVCLQDACDCELDNGLSVVENYCFEAIPFLSSSGCPHGCRQHGDWAPL